MSSLNTISQILILLTFILILLIAQIKATDQFKSDTNYSISTRTQNFTNCLKKSKDPCGDVHSDNESENTNTVINILNDINKIIQIKGRIEKTTEFQKEFRAFYGIPYGLIPHRFNLAQMVGLFDFDARKKQLACMQPPLTPFINHNEITEDCLSLNIFTPFLKNQSSLLPVIVFIHGGSFFRWSGSMFRGHRFLDERDDIIIVSINYRINLFGFFNLENEFAPGNLALYDQILALKWIQKYIQYFGGDSSKVTLAGQSAGAAAVTLLQGSQLAVGLFHKVIASSGDASAAWAIEPHPLQNSLKAATALHCANGTRKDQDLQIVLQCMRYLPAKRLLDAIPAFFSAPSYQTYDLSRNIPKVLLNDKIAINRDSTIPLLLGVNRNDGSFLMSRVYTQHLKSIKDPGYFKYQFLQDLISAPHFRIKGDENNATLNTIRSIYIDQNHSNQFQGFVDLFSSFYFKRTVCKRAVKCAKNGSNCHVYLYSFDYNGNNTWYPMTGGVEQISKGVAHGDDLHYLFPLGKLTSPNELLISHHLINTWVNFAIHGHPNSIGALKRGDDLWEPFQEQDEYRQYKSINSKGISSVYMSSVWNKNQLNHCFL